MYFFYCQKEIEHRYWFCLLCIWALRSTKIIFTEHFFTISIKSYWEIDSFSKIRTCAVSSGLTWAPDLSRGRPSSGRTAPTATTSWTRSQPAAPPSRPPAWPGARPPATSSCSRSSSTPSASSSNTNALYQLKQTATIYWIMSHFWNASHTKTTNLYCTPIISNDEYRFKIEF